MNSKTNGIEKRFCGDSFENGMGYTLRTVTDIIYFVNMGTIFKLILPRKRERLILKSERCQSCANRGTAFCLLVMAGSGPGGMKRTEWELLIFGVREADLAGIAKNRSFHKIGFADVGEVTCGTREFSGTAGDANGIGDHGKESAGVRDWHGRCDGRINVDGISRFCYPVMLNAENEGPTRAGLRIAQ
jgi:hypothetical protein